MKPRLSLVPAEHPGVVLNHDEVHLWTTTLDLPASEVQELLETLSIDERARADRYHFAHDRMRFTVARGVLRAILGCYLNTPPEELRFYYSPHGKPDLVEDAALRFNVSHSGGIAVYGITRGRAIGVDIERIRGIVDIESISERFFSPQEVAVLGTLPPQAHAVAFFACWTRKEAYIKARGEGLSMPLDRFDVSLAPGEPAALLRAYGDPLEASRWSLRAFAPAPGYVAALAVEGQGLRLKTHHWP